MKIGIYDPYLDTMSGGEKYFLTAALCLAKQHQISVFWDLAEISQIKLEAKRKFNLDLEPIQFKQNIFKKDVPLVSRLIGSRYYDYIIYLSDGSIPFLLSKLIVHFQTPVEWLNHTSLKTRLKIARVEKIICNSQYTKSFIDKKFSVDSFVLYPPVVIPAETGKIKKENVILNVGRFGIKSPGSSYKKQEVLVNVFKRMVDAGLKGWSLHLLISVFEKDIETLAGIKERIKGYPVYLILNPDNDELWTEYAKTKIYWHASGFGEDLNLNPDRAEHFGISTVEAMGAGAVPVVINAGGQPEIVHDGQNGYLWDSESEMIDKTYKLINDEKTRERLSYQAKKDSTGFSAGSFCRSLSSLIK